MKKLFKIALTFLMLIALMMGCKKDPLPSIRTTIYQQEAKSVSQQEISQALASIASEKSGERGKLATVWENAVPDWDKLKEVSVSGRRVSFIPIGNQQFLVATKDGGDDVHLIIQAFWSNTPEVDNAVLSTESFSGGMFQITSNGYTQNEFLITNGRITGRYSSEFNQSLAHETINSSQDNTNFWLLNRSFIIYGDGSRDEDPCDSCPSECQCLSFIIRTTYANLYHDPSRDLVTLMTLIFADATSLGSVNIFMSSEELSSQTMGEYYLDTEVENAKFCNCNDTEGGGGESGGSDPEDPENPTIDPITGGPIDGGGDNERDWIYILDA